MPTPQNVKDAIPAFQQCIWELATNAVDIYRGLELYLAPDSHTQYSTAGYGDLDRAQIDISAFLKSEFAVSSRISVIASDTTLKASAQDAPAIQQLTSMQKLIDTVANDLMGYSQRLIDLGDFDNGAQDCANIIDVSKEKDKSIKCVSITSNRDDDRVYRNMVTRTITYSLNSLNLVSNSQEAAPDPTKKRLLVSTVINFADSSTTSFSSLRFEASAGAFFSSLPIRSFSVAPIYSGGQIVNNIITQNVLHPTVVPFAAANYRITDDLPWGRWKTNLYLTGAVGINPNTVSADFAAGISFAWRGLMFSPLWHYGHDSRLTQGLYVGEPLGAGFKGSLATQNYWTSSVALGVSIRVPSLVGR
jgi:hypothetical protein